MRTIWYSRRCFIASLAILSISVVGIYKGYDVSMAIASVAVGIAGANAYESKTDKKS